LTLATLSAATGDKVMCLAIPGKLLSKVDHDGSLIGRVEFGGIAREVQLDFVPEAEVGDYVIVHVGFALSRLDREEAERTLQILREMGALEAEGLEPEAAGDSPPGSDQPG
jgi:hydrogenase expression/formation protein HypC